MWKPTFTIPSVTLLMIHWSVRHCLRSPAKTRNVQQTYRQSASLLILKSLSTVYSCSCLVDNLYTISLWVLKQTVHKELVYVSDLDYGVQVLLAVTMEMMGTKLFFSQNVEFRNSGVKGE